MLTSQSYCKAYVIHVPCFRVCIPQKAYFGAERGVITAEEVQRDSTLAAALERCDAGSVVLECAAAAAGHSPPTCGELAPSDCISICCQLAPSGTLRPMVSKAAGQRQAVLHALQQLAGP